MTVDLDALIDAVTARWPGLPVDRPGVSAALDQRGIASDAALAFDVVLACALAIGDRCALQIFERELVPGIRGALVRLDRSGDLVEDALQQVREKLLVGADQPRILEYRGKGPLAAWIQIVAIREVLMLQRKARPARAGDDALYAIVETDPALALAKRTYRAQLAEAFRDAMTALAPRERALLRLCFVDGVGTERLAETYAVHRVTMFRWLCDARANLLDGIRARLAASTGIGADEIDSLIRAVASSFDIGW